MRPEEVRALGLFERKQIENMKEIFNPSRTVACVADFHIGAWNGLNLPVYTCLDGSKIEAPPVSRAIYEFAYLPFLEICDWWEVTDVLVGGDVINATAEKRIYPARDIVFIDDALRMAEALLDPLMKDRSSVWISGSPYHDSVDTRVHLRLAKHFKGKATTTGYACFKIEDLGVLLSHVGRRGALYPDGVIQRSVFFDAYGRLKSSDYSKIDLRISAHWHKWTEHEGVIELPGWQGYFSYRGRVIDPGIRLPDIGGVILLVRGRDYLAIPYLFDVETFWSEPVEVEVE